MTPSGSGCPVMRQAENCQIPFQQPACNQLALVPQLSLWGDREGVAAHWPQRLQMHQLQDCSEQPIPSLGSMSSGTGRSCVSLS